MGKTKIEWTRGDDGELGYTWNPIRGCSRVSAGCKNCYAEKMAARFSDEGQPYHGLATRSPARWTGEVRLVEEHLNDPLKWKQPRRIFVNSMSDLFHEKLTNEEIVRVFDVMSKAPQHVFQVLTKRPKRMLEFISLMSHLNTACDRPEEWPLSNVWLGVSVEDQKTADERIPLLLKTPAAVRFISAEPLLGPVDLETANADPYFRRSWLEYNARLGVPGPRWAYNRLDWVIVGGESGAGARPLHINAARSIVKQCEAANVACLVKQLGARIHGDPREFPTSNILLAPSGGEYAGYIFSLRDRKGGDVLEWPADLRVRQFPATPREAATA